MPDRSTMQDALLMAQLAIGGQGVAGAVLQRSIPELETIVVDLKALQARRDRLVEALSSFGYEVHVPDGTFYLLPASPIGDDQAFVERLAREKVFVLPGHLVEMPGRFRISVTGNDDMVERAIAVFERAAHHPG
jgi:aspartate aminotransferase